MLIALCMTVACAADGDRSLEQLEGEDELAPIDRLMVESVDDEDAEVAPSRSS